ncbi:MAG TPA: GNAT family N-acetyltransferase [Saprospiraceae bacterium]|nr:GNAT family N-acetyltransferase [Saprospiraceae bacterium]HMP25063.1 GNAT family N-acetyltransferase [Saprospiraceae bacterium]
MISTASLTDINELVSLINSAYRGESAKQGWTTESDLIQGLRTDAEDMQQILTDPNTTFLKYTDATGAIIGCMRLQRRDNRLYLGMLTVSPILQTQGIGKQLLYAAEIEAQRQGCHAIFMTVFSIRTELIAWYQRHGYHFTGEVIPFQPNPKFEILNQPLEFWVLEKKMAILTKSEK